MKSDELVVIIKVLLLSKWRFYMICVFMTVVLYYKIVFQNSYKYLLVKVLFINSYIISHLFLWKNGFFSKRATRVLRLSMNRCIFRYFQMCWNTDPNDYSACTETNGSKSMYHLSISNVIFAVNETYGQCWSARKSLCHSFGAIWLFCFQFVMQLHELLSVVIPRNHLIFD